MLLKLLSLFTRLAGDAFHTYTMILLIHKVRATRSCSGLSLKTQILYLTVFTTRYMDIFYMNFSRYILMYNFIMKLVYLSLQATIIYLIRFKYFYTHDKKADSFPIITLIVPSLVLAFVLKPRTYTFFGYVTEYAWNFSLLLECVAILPQLVLLQDTGEAEVLTSRYVFCLGMYRLLYVVGWGLKKASGMGVDVLLFATGIIQSLLHADFFVLYYRYVFSKYKNQKIPQ